MATLTDDHDAMQGRWTTGGMRALLLLAMTACGGSSGSDVDAAEVDAPEIDAIPIDAPVDAPVDAPIVGAACVAQPTEVARITGAAIRPNDIDFDGHSHLSAFYTGDVDGDGDNDLTVYEFVSSTTTQWTYRVRVFPRQPGGFGAVRSSTLVLPAYGTDADRLGDFDGDGDADLLLRYTTEFPRTTYGYLARQDATGAFVLDPRRDLSACRTSQDERGEALAVLDVQGDGRDDVLATTNYDGLGGAPAGMAQLLGGTTGLGAATCVAPVAAPAYPTAMAQLKATRVADVDGDQRDDLLAMTSTRMTLYRSTGGPAFVAGAQTQATPIVEFVELDALPGHAATAVLAFTVTSASTMIARYPVSAAGVGAPTTVATLPQAGDGGGDVRGFALGDFNGDQRIDALVMGIQSSSTAPGFAVACDRGGAWQFAAGVMPDVHYLRAYDYDGDGRSEVVGAVGNDVVVWRLD